MYVKTTTNKSRELTANVTSIQSWTSKIHFNVIPNAIEILGEQKTGIQSSSLLGNYLGGIILPKSHSKEEVDSLKIRKTQGNLGQFIVLDGNKYYSSLLKIIGEPKHGPSYWLVDNGETVAYYYGDDLKPESKVFKDVPSQVFYDLLSSYPKLRKGSPPALLNTLFRVCQEGIRQKCESQQIHLHHPEQRSYFERGASVMTEVAEQILYLLKGSLVN